MARASVSCLHGAHLTVRAETLSSRIEQVLAAGRKENQYCHNVTHLLCWSMH